MFLHDSLVQLKCEIEHDHSFDGFKQTLSLQITAIANKSFVISFDMYTLVLAKAPQPFCFIRRAAIPSTSRPLKLPAFYYYSVIFENNQIVRQIHFSATSSSSSSVVLLALLFRNLKWNRSFVNVPKFDEFLSFISFTVCVML